MKFRVYNSRFKDFKYWGFIDGLFISAPTGSGISIELCKKLTELFCGQDANGNEYYINDICKDEYDKLFVVVWENNCVQFAYEEFTRPAFFTEYFEVVSNVHIDFDILSNSPRLKEYQLNIIDFLISTR